MLAPGEFVGEFVGDEIGSSDGSVEERSSGERGGWVVGDADDVGEVVFGVARCGDDFDVHVTDAEAFAGFDRVVVEVECLGACVGVGGRGGAAEGESAADVVVVDVRLEDHFERQARGR